MSDDLPDIELEDSGSKGRYFLRSPEGAVAEMTFTKVGEQHDHHRPYRGAGCVSRPGRRPRLVTRAVEDVRAAGKKIIPLCPFANAQFRRHRNGRTC